jgi:hypothetical protein
MSRPCAVCANPYDPREVTVGFHLCCGDVIATSLQASKKYGPARRLKAGPNLTKEQRYGVSCIAPPQRREKLNYVVPHVRSIPRKMQSHYNFWGKRWRCRKRDV